LPFNEELHNYYISLGLTPSTLLNGVGTAPVGIKMPGQGPGGGDRLGEVHVFK